MWRWYSGLEELDPRDWCRRVMTAPRPSPFLTPAFLLPWASAFAGPLRVGLWGETGLALFHQRGDVWELLGGQDVADRLDVVGDDPLMWEELRREASSWGGAVEFPNLAPDSNALRFLQSGDRLEETDRSPYTSLSGSFSDYLSGLPRKARHELKRKMARVQRMGESLVVDHSPDQLETFLRLHRQSHPDKHAFMQDKMERFFRELHQSLWQAGMLWLATLKDGGRALASVFQIRFAGVAHLYNSGYDPEASALSPGLVLIARCIERSCEEGLSEYDFLRGTERYKYDLGGRDRSVVRLAWEERRDAHRQQLFQGGPG